MIGEGPVPFDPTNCGALRNFDRIVRSTACPFAPKALLWGAPAWRPSETFERNVSRLALQFRHFFAASQTQPLDGLVVEVSHPFACGSMKALAESFGHLLWMLVAMDGVPNPSFEGDFLVPGWQFELQTVRFFISVFSPLYSTNHQRFSSEGTFVMFQPEESFRHHRVGGPYRNARIVKQQVRRDFAARGIDYMTSLIEERVEAPIYLLPRFPDDGDANWWASIKKLRRSL